MRRLLLPFCCIFILCGCSKPRELPSLVQFCCDFTVQHNEQTLKGNLKRFSTGTLTLYLSEPENLNGLQVTIGEDATTISLGNLEFKAESTLLQSAVPRLLCDALDDAFYAFTVGETVQGDVVSGRVGAYAYTLSFDPQTGFIQTAQFPSADVKIEFFNIQKL